MAKNGGITAVRRISRAELLLVGILLLVAGGLRLGWPGLTEFKADEARLLALALEMAEGGGLARRGISSSIGFPNFPMSVWLYALPLFIWPHVVAATLFTGLLNTLAVAACYWFVRRYWGMRAALAATLLLAVSPWAVLFSRKIWAQNLLPLFVMGWVIGAALALVERRPKFFLLHFLCLAVAVETHLAAVTLLPVTAVLLLIFWRRIQWGWLAAGVLLAALTAVPFAVYLGQQDQLALPTGGDTTLSLDSLRLTARLSLGADIHALAGPEAFADYLTRTPGRGLVYAIWGGLMLLGVVRLIRLAQQGWRERGLTLSARWGTSGRETAVIVLLWLLGPPLFFLAHNTPIFIHYFIAVLPAPYIAAGLLFDWLLRGGKALRYLRFKPSPAGGRVLAVVGWLTLGGTAVFQAWAVAALIAFVGQTATPGGFGTPLERRLAAADAARLMLVATGSDEVLIAGEGESPRLDEFPAVYDVLLRGVPHRFVDVTRSALFPAGPTVVLLDEGEMGALYRDAATHRETIPLRPGEGSMTVLALPESAAPEPAVEFSPPVLLANWVNLMGYDGPIVEGETAVWQIYWRTGDNPDTVVYQFFNHLLDGSGERVSQVDGPAFAPWQWRAGDVVVSRFRLAWQMEAERPFTMRVGMYTYPDLAPVLLLDEAGNPYSDAVEILLGEQ